MCNRFHVLHVGCLYLLRQGASMNRRGVSEVTKRNRRRRERIILLYIKN